MRLLPAVINVSSLYAVLIIIRIMMIVVDHDAYPSLTTLSQNNERVCDIRKLISMRFFFSVHPENNKTIISRRQNFLFETLARLRVKILHVCIHCALSPPRWKMIKFVPERWRVVVVFILYNIIIIYPGRPI